MPGGHYPKKFLVQWLHRPRWARNGGSSLQKPVALEIALPFLPIESDPLDSRAAALAQPVAGRLRSGAGDNPDRRANRVPLSLQIQIRRRWWGRCHPGLIAAASALPSARSLDVVGRTAARPMFWSIEAGPGIGEVLARLMADFHSFVDSVKCGSRTAREAANRPRRSLAGAGRPISSLIICASHQQDPPG